MKHPHAETVFVPMPNPFAKRSPRMGGRERKPVGGKGCGRAGVGMNSAQPLEIRGGNGSAEQALGVQGGCVRHRLRFYRFFRASLHFLAKRCYLHFRLRMRGELAEPSTYVCLISSVSSIRLTSEGHCGREAASCAFAGGQMVAAGNRRQGWRPGPGSVGN